MPSVEWAQLRSPEQLIFSLVDHQARLAYYDFMKRCANTHASGMPFHPWGELEPDQRHAWRIAVAHVLHVDVKYIEAEGEMSDAHSQLGRVQTRR